MNKVVVGVSPSPNISKSSSKIGSLANSNYKPGGGQVKIENRKLEWNAAPRTKTVNKDYTPGGGDKKVKSQYSNLEFALVTLFLLVANLLVRVLVRLLSKSSFHIIIQKKFNWQ